MSDRLFDSAQLADYLGISRKRVYASTTLRAIVHDLDLGTGTGKKPRLRWLESEVLAAVLGPKSCETDTLPAGPEAAPATEPAKQKPGRPRRVPSTVPTERSNR